MFPRWLAFAIGISLGSSSACSRVTEPEKAKAPAPPPNILLITVDTLRADRLGCYGYEPARTPHTDSLAAEGVQVDHAIAPTPLTLPSHTSILTGLEPPAHGVRDNGTFRVPDAAQTLAERLKGEGYQTQAFVSADVLHHRFNLNQGFDGYDDDLWSEGVGSGMVVRQRSGEKTMNRVLRWLETRTASSAPPPFFLWVHLFDPHAPYAPPAVDAKRSPTPYDGEIASVDRQIGRLVKALEPDGVLDETILVFTSDHGESLGEHQEDTHAMFIYESTQRVPLILRYPRKLPAGKIYRGPARSVDIMPTILSLAGKEPNDTQGADLSKALAGGAPAPPLLQYSESLHPKLMFGMAPLHGVRVDAWTYVRAPRPELYDRRADPRELRNLLEGGGSGTATAKAFELDAVLNKVTEDSERFALVAEAKPLDPQTVEMLRALGYMGDSDAPEDLGGMDPKDGVRIFNEVGRAIALTNSGDCDAAGEILRSVLKRLPGLIRAHNTLAVCAFNMGNAEAAKGHYLKSLAHKPQQPEVYLQLGRIHVAQGQYESARRRCAQVLELLPDSGEAMLLMGNLYYVEGQLDEATRWYDKAIAAEPERADGYLQQGDLYFGKGEFHEARGWYEKALGFAPENYAASLKGGFSALRLGDLQGAEQHLRRASESAPAQWQPLYALACVESQRGDIEASLRYLENAAARGFGDAATLQRDPCMQPLSAQPRFQGLVRALVDRPRRGAGSR